MLGPAHGVRQRSGARARVQDRLLRAWAQRKNDDPPAHPRDREARAPRQDGEPRHARRPHALLRFPPIRLPKVRGMGVRLQLFTVPGQVYYNATRKLVLTGADGWCSCPIRRRAGSTRTSRHSRTCGRTCRSTGAIWPSVPHIVQHNKRDLTDLLSLEELDEMLNPPPGAVVRDRRHPWRRRLPVAGGDHQARGRRLRVEHSAGERQLAAQLEAIEGGLSEALRNADANESLAPKRLRSSPA